MLPEHRVLKFLKQVSPESLSGAFYRIIRVDFIQDPLGAFGSKKTGGRYNLKGKHEVLYLASEPDLALKESLPGFSVKFPPSILFTVETRLASVIDLTSAEVREGLGVTAENLLTPWRHAQNMLGKEAITQRLGRLIRASRRFEAIVYPSHVDPNRSNLGILMDRLKQGSSIDIYDPERIMEWVFRGKK